MQGSGGVGPGTYPLSETAVVKVRGGDLPEPDSRQEEIVLAAWRLYRYISARARRTGAAKVHNGTEWHTWEGSIESAARVLWPAGTPLVKGELWPEGYRTVRDWLIRKTGPNLVSTDAGRPGTSSRREGQIAPRLPHWLVRDQFTGAPPGMRLPDLDDSGRVVEPLPAALARESTPAPPAPPAEQEAPWWCPFTLKGDCREEGPYTRGDLGLHIQRSHKFKAGGMMYAAAITEAEAIRENRRLSSPPPSPPAPEPPARSIVEMVARAPDPIPAALAPVPAAIQAQSSVSGGSVSAQGRVFAMQVAEVEAENTGLRRRVAELEAELHQVRAREREMRLYQQDIDAIAHRTAALLQSKNGTAG